MLEINYTALTATLPDTHRRKPTRIDWLNVNTVGLATLYTEAVSKYNDAIFLARHNYQVISIESAINKSVLLNSPAYIIDGEWLELNYLTLIGENYIEQEFIDISTSDVYAYTEAEFNVDIVDFYIVIDLVDADKVGTITSIVNKLVQGGKNFEIITV